MRKVDLVRETNLRRREWYENGGFDLNARDNTGMTPFRVGCSACKKTNTEITKLFLTLPKKMVVLT